MHTIELRVPGEYYDSLIYSGRLYLWSADGSILELDWNRLIEERVLPTLDQRLHFAIHCCFRRGSYLYSYDWSYFRRDSEMLEMLVDRFRELANTPIQLSEIDIARSMVKERDNPFVFPHADIVRHEDRFYVGSSKGLQVSDYAFENSVKKVWDGPAYSLDVNQKQIAIAAGSDGLFEHAISSLNHAQSKLTKMQETHSSNFVRWVYPSLYGSSYDGGHLYNYAIQKAGDDEQDEQKDEKRRVFLGTIADDDLYEQVLHKPALAGYSWGVRDKICFAKDSRINVVKYIPDTPSKSKNSLNFALLSSATCGAKWGNIIGADSAHFGYIIEVDDGLWVLKSNEEWMWLEGEPVNWRIFPNTQDYLNQLHVINDDYLSVFAFTHDYSVLQPKKRFGISFRTSKRRS